MWSGNSTNSGRSRAERRFADAAGELRRDQRIAPGSQTAGWLRPCMGPSESTDARCSERPQSVCPTCDAAHPKRERLRRGGLVAGGERRFAARSFRARLLSCKCCERATVASSPRCGAQRYRRSCARRAIQCLHQLDAAAPLAAVTERPRARADRAQEVLEHPAVPPHVRHYGRRGAGIGAARFGRRWVLRRPELDGDDPVVLDDDGSLRARELDAPRESRECRSGRLERADGAAGTLEAATSTFPGFPRRVELTGSEGTVIVEHDRVVSVQLRAPQHPPPAEAGSTNASATSPVVSDVRGHRRVLEDFLCAIRTGARPLCDGREGRRSVELVQALYRSARAGAAVALGAAPGA